MTQTAFYVSDGTAITAEVLGHATLSQYEVEFEHKTLPFIVSEDEAQNVQEQINQSFAQTGKKPFVFYTFVNKTVKHIIEQSNAHHFDALAPFADVISQQLGVLPNPKLHRTHSIHKNTYDHRIDAMNFALANDDGQTTQNYQAADVILIGVSRSGKTPTSLYLALQYGIKAANYPFISEDMENLKLPPALQDNQHKLFGLTIEPKRLAAIRNERYANSKYASIGQCRMELREVERLYAKARIPFINTTHFSVEEISAKIISIMKLQRHKY